MTVFKGKKVTLRPGANYGRGDDPHGVTAGAAKQSRDAFLATEPEPHLAELRGETPSLGGGSFREDRLSDVTYPNRQESLDRGMSINKDRGHRNMVVLPDNYREMSEEQKNSFHNHPGTIDDRQQELARRNYIW